MADAGVQVLGTSELGEPAGVAWTEAGELDHRGHHHGLRLAHEVDGEVQRIASRIEDLLGAGWTRVTVVTDHGWLLVPGGLPKNENLPIAVTDTKKGRCARVKEGADPLVPTVPWHWDSDVRIAVAPGISCFEANQTYEHGGVSPQECVVPRLTVSRGESETAGAVITSMKWRGLMLIVEFSGLPDGATIDLRIAAGAAQTSIADTAGVTGGQGKAILLVGDEDLEGVHAQLVLIGADGSPTYPTRDHCGAKPMTGLDALDALAAEVFDGYLVKKDLAQQFRGQYPVPTYVGEFMLGRYCATTVADEIAAGLEMVQQSMQDRTVRAGEEELFKHRAREKGRVKIIDLLRARLDSRSDAYKAELPGLQINDIHISAELVDEHQRMLTGGFYAEVTLEYIADLAGEQGGQPFRVDAIRPIQMSTRKALGTFIGGRSSFTLEQWRELLLRSVGFDPSRLNPRQQDVLIARMVPFVVRNYNAVELGPRGTGKSHLFQQVSPYAHLVSGGKATVANMFVNMNTGRRGLVAQYDVICFDEVSGVSFDQQEGVNILKGYMESGEFSRGRESIRAEGGIVMVGNFDVDVETQLRVGHLLSPLPKEMRNDTAFMDRIHAYLPGWDVPKLDPSYLTRHFGFVSDFLAEVWSQLASLHPTRRAARTARVGQPAQRT